MKTERGIYLDITESDYCLENKDYKFYFSSEVYLNKFNLNYKEYATQEVLKIYNNYKFFIPYQAFWIVYYKKIEKRGFRIYDKEAGKYLKKKDITFYISKANL